tara:strand:- start:434 stop:1582 length:1149 start_codon:yes stop_codon:yes gene_type:complete
LGWGFQLSNLSACFNACNNDISKEYTPPAPAGGIRTATPSSNSNNTAPIQGAAEDHVARIHKTAAEETARDANNTVRVTMEAAEATGNSLNGRRLEGAGVTIAQQVAHYKESDEKDKKKRELRRQLQALDDFIKRLDELMNDLKARIAENEKTMQAIEAMIGRIDKGEFDGLTTKQLQKHFEPLEEEHNIKLDAQDYVDENGIVTEESRTRIKDDLQAEYDRLAQEVERDTARLAEFEKQKEIFSELESQHMALDFGEISPEQMLNELRKHADITGVDLAQLSTKQDIKEYLNLITERAGQLDSDQSALTEDLSVKQFKLQALEYQKEGKSGAEIAELMQVYLDKINQDSDYPSKIESDPQCTAILNNQTLAHSGASAQLSI